MGRDVTEVGGVIPDHVHEEAMKPYSSSAVAPRPVDQLRLKTDLRYDLEFHECGTLPRYTVKARRFKDLRKIHQTG